MNSRHETRGRPPPAGPRRPPRRMLVGQPRRPLHSLEPAGGLGRPDSRDERQRQPSALSPEPPNASLAAQPGHLYVVATPIGNLADLTERARAHPGFGRPGRLRGHPHDRALLHRLGISRELVAYHEHNETEAAERLAERRSQPASSVALATDAGTPGPQRPRIPRRPRLPPPRACPSSPFPARWPSPPSFSASGLPTQRLPLRRLPPARSPSARLGLLRQAHGLRLHGRPLRKLPPDRQGHGRHRRGPRPRAGSSASPRRSPSSMRPSGSAPPARSATASPRRASRANSRS